VTGPALHLHARFKKPGTGEVRSEAGGPGGKKSGKVILQEERDFLDI
jgi:hypothetical protein